MDGYDGYVWILMDTDSLRLYLLLSHHVYLLLLVHPLVFRHLLHLHLLLLLLLGLSPPLCNQGLYAARQVI